MVCLDEQYEKLNNEIRGLLERINNLPSINELDLSIIEEQLKEIKDISKNQPDLSELLNTPQANRIRELIGELFNYETPTPKEESVIEPEQEITPEITAENLDDKISEVSGEPISDWTNALSLFRGCYNSIIDSIQLSEMKGLDLNKTMITMIGAFLEKNNYLKYNPARMISKNKYLQSIINETTLNNEEIEKAIKPQLTIKATSDFLQSIPTLNQSEPYRTDMLEAKQILSTPSTWNFLREYVKEKMESGIENLTPEETYTCALMQLKNLDPRLALRINQGIGSVIYQMIKDVKQPITETMTAEVCA